MKCNNARTCLLVALLFTAVLPVTAMWPEGMLAVSTASAQTKVKSPHGDYKEDCSLCHRATGWKPAQISKKFDHEKFGIPLKGAHAEVQCMQCHKSLDFSDTSAGCIDCHADVHSGELGTDCARCHGTRSFIDRNDQIRMHRLTRFPLAGAHQTLDCEMCHRLEAPGGLSWVNTPAECVSCHLNDYNETTRPSHVAAGYSHECSACHNEQSWRRVDFDHNQTGFPLSGVHATISCENCHVGGVFTGLSTACVSCHQQDYDGTSNPNHAGAGFATECQQCHNTRGWTGVNFDHSRTAFALTGAHRSVGCNECHANGVYSGTPMLCVSCHQQEYDSTTDPNHAATGFSTECQQCHNTNAWAGANFDHNATAFPLTGAHRSVGCNLCHANGVYAGTSTLCVSCHQQDYNSTANPNHVSAGFPTDCEQCHSTVSWAGADFNHNTTAFPLTGAHRSVGCNECHANGVYSGTPMLCVSCHQQDYNGTTNPDHVSAAFPTDCEQCHSTVGWAGADFDHSITGFPLTGAHVGRPCSDCHVNNRYSGMDPACVACHQSDYNGTTNPDHAASGFSTECTLCHNTAAWAGATFNHTGFPIYSGRHAGRWRTCDECHVNPSNFADFNCLGCHPHSDKAGTDSDHRGRSGYSYDSNACYRCHPNGRA